MRGQRTRSALVAAAEHLLAGRTVGEVGVSQIAAAAGAFPSQVTYYFGSKEGLFVEVAFRSLLREAATLEKAARYAATPEQFNLTLSRAAGQMTSVASVAGALLIVRRRPELSKIAQYGINVLFRQSEVYLARTLTARGWTCTRPLEREVRTFWRAVLGSALFDSVPVVGGGNASIGDVLTVRAVDG